MGWLQLCSIEINFMHTGHFDQVMEIISDVCDPTYTLDGLRNTLSNQSVHAFVARSTDRCTLGDVLGFLIFYVHPSKLELMALAVKRDRWRLRIGRQLINKLKCEAIKNKIIKIESWVRDRNLIGQMFLQSCFFRAVQVREDFDEDPPADLYVFRYRSDQPPESLDLIRLQLKRFSDGDFFQRPLLF